MNPLSLSLLNIGPFPSLELAFVDGVTAISAPNGGGKSTILNAVELALFARGGRDLAPLLGPFGDRLQITLTFEHGGEEHRVRRSYKATGRGTATLDLERFIGDGPQEYWYWESLTRETAAETQTEIERILGLSRKLFNASAFLEQGKADLLASLDPADAKSLVGELTDPRGLYPKLCKRAAADVREVEWEVTVAGGQIATLQQNVDGRPAAEQMLIDAEDHEVEARAHAAMAMKLSDQAQATLTANAAALAEVRRLSEAAVAARRDQARAETDHRDAAEAETALDAAREAKRLVARRASQLPDLEARDRRFQEARNEAASVAALMVQRAALRARLEKIVESGPAAICDACEQELGREARAIRLTKLGAEIERLDEEIGDRDTAGALPEDVTEKLAEAREADRQHAALTERITHLEQQAARLPALAGDLLSAIQAAAETEGALRDARLVAEDAGDEGSLLRALDDAKVAVMQHRRALGDAAQAATRAKVALERIEMAEQELAALTASTSDALARLDILRLAERCFGRDGVPVLLLETVIPQIEAEANRVLMLMPTAKGETFRVELRTLREQKTTETLRETLDIVVHDGRGARPYETFSGGESGRLNVALRLALAHVLATRRGAEVRMLALDEVEYLDALGQEQLVDVVRSVEPTFGKVLLVSHNERVRDSFENVVELETVDGVSRGVAAAPTAVAA